MTAFDYLAVDRAGRRRSGVETGADEAAARARLAGRGLEPLSLRPRAGADENGRGSQGVRLGAARLALITRQLATLVEVTPLEEALRALAMQAEHPRQRRVLQGVHAAVLEGRRLSDAMAGQGRAFPPLYRAMVAAGERSGALPMILGRLADQLEHRRQVRGKITAALVYPAVLTVVALGVVGALMVFVVPRIVEQFDTMNQALPPLTLAVIAVSTFLREWGWTLGVAVGLGVVALVMTLRHEAARLRLDRLILKTPVVGRLVREVNGASMARTLSLMIAGGLPALEGLSITAGTVGNRALRAATQEMAQAVREGGSLSAAMRRAGVFPPILTHMTASGEASGRLEPLLDRAADYLERQFNAFTGMALTLMEPLVIVVMGGVVGVIVLSILLPILQLNTLAAG